MRYNTGKKFFFRDRQLIKFEKMGINAILKVIIQVYSKIGRTS